MSVPAHRQAFAPLPLIEIIDDGVRIELHSNTKIE